MNKRGRKITRRDSDVYEFASLSKYPLRQRILISLADWSFYALLNLIGKTLRFEVEGWEHLEKIGAAGENPIYTFWHERLFSGTYFFRNRGIVVITSQSFDGEYIARFIKRFGYGAIRGSSTRGGVGALVEMIRLMRRGAPMGFTIDGPKGPRRVAKMGACLLAKKTGNPILPFTVETARYWQIGSWDKLQIPRPFSAAKVLIAEPLYVPEDAGDAALENKRQELQKRLDELDRRGEEWRKTGKS